MKTIETYVTEKFRLRDDTKIIDKTKDNEPTIENEEIIEWVKDHYDIDVVDSSYGKSHIEECIFSTDKAFLQQNFPWIKSGLHQNVLRYIVGKALRSTDAKKELHKLLNKYVGLNKVTTYQADYITVMVKSGNYFIKIRKYR